MLRKCQWYNKKPQPANNQIHMQMSFSQSPHGFPYIYICLWESWDIATIVFHYSLISSFYREVPSSQQQDNKRKGNFQMVG